MVPGTIGRYEVIRELGHGGMAVVYLARDPLMKRQVAIKVLPRQFTFDPQFRSRFQREAEVIAALEHAYIVPVHDYGELEEQPYIVMRYMPGGSLAERIAKGRLPAAETAAIVERIAAAIDYAHSRKVIHRDLKPGNILFDAQGEAFLSDFGIAKIVEASAAFTGAGVIGTPAYMSPEQALGGKDIDGRSDIYSLGVIVFQALSGQLPFEADTPMGLAVAHINTPAPGIRQVRPDLPASYETMLNRALAKEPARRYSLASDLAQEFKRIASGQAQAASQAGPTLFAGPQAQPLPAETPAPAGPQAQPPPAGTPAPAASTQTPPPPSAVPPAGGAAAYPARPRRIPGWAWLAGAAGLAGLCLLLVLGGSFLWNALQNGDTAQGLPAQASPTVLVQAATDTPQAGGEQILASNPLTQAPPVGSSQIYVEYILDASGSMMETVQGKTRLAIAQDVLSARVAALPPDIRVGLRVYGHRIPFQQEAESCEDIELVVPIQQDGAAKIVAWLPGMQAQGMTPMSESIRQAAEDFTFEPGRQNSIVLISDGIETCGDDPTNVVRYLQELGIDFTIHVIGLLVDPQARDQLSRVAEVSGGVYHDANSEQDLAEALDAVNNEVIETALIALAQPPQASPTPPEPTPTELPAPAAIVDVTSQGSAQASTIYDATFPASLSVDGDPSTSWFSAGPGSGGTTTYQWSGVQDDLIASVSIISNRQHQRRDFRTGFGFGQVIVQVLDASGQVVWEQTAALQGTPDPDVLVQPGVVGRSILLTFSGHEDPTCGGFGELLVEVSR